RRRCGRQLPRARHRFTVLRSMPSSRAMHFTPSPRLSRAMISRTTSSRSITASTAPAGHGGDATRASSRSITLPPVARREGGILRDDYRGAFTATDDTAHRGALLATRGAAMLMRAVDCYLAVRRAAGYELTVPDYRIRSMNCVAHTRGAAAYMTPHRWH